MANSSTGTIASIGNYANGGQTFSQYLDNVYVYSTNLTAAQVAQLYTATASTMPAGQLPNTSNT